jgi:hypothetical protein
LYSPKAVDDFEKAFIRIRKILKEKKWPGVEEGQNWGTPSLKVKGKMLVRLREPGVLVFMCPLDAKEMLLQVAPHIYFELPHYKGYPAILAKMDAIEDDEIAEMVEEHWRKIAPKKLVAEFDEGKSKSNADVRSVPTSKMRAKDSPGKAKQVPVKRATNANVLTKTKTHKQATARAKHKGSSV